MAVAKDEARARELLNTDGCAIRDDEAPDIVFTAADDTPEIAETFPDAECC